MQLIHGDCLEKMKDIPDKSVKMVLADPPYWHKKSPGKPYSQRNMSETKSKLANSPMYHATESHMMAGMSEFTPDILEEYLKEAARVCKIPNIYSFCNDTLLGYYGMFAEQNNLHFSVLIWEKPLSVTNKNRFSQHCEYITRIYGYGTGLNRLGDSSLYSRVKRYNQIRGKNKLHTTEKPVKLLEEFVLLSSDVGDVILDPFMGSGSTGIACKNLGRNFIGIEKDDKYFEVAKNRINNHLTSVEPDTTGVQPVNADCGAG